MAEKATANKIFTYGLEMFQRFKRDDVFGLSAQLAYFFLLSLFPFLIFLVTLVGYLPFSTENVLSLVKEYAPGDTYLLLESILHEIKSQQRGGLLSLGVIATIWSASNGVNAVIRALNKAYDVEENRSFLVARFMAILLTIGMIVVIIISLLLPVFGEAIGIFIFSHFGLGDSFLSIWNTFRWTISFFVIIVILSGLYAIAPNRKLRLREVWIGAVFATLGWQFVSLAFSYYVREIGHFSATYGSIGGIIVLMVWFYLSGMIIIVGGQINALIKKFRSETS